MIKKVIFNIFTVIGVLAILVGIFWLVTLTPLWPFPLFGWEYEELTRIESPDGQYEIVPFQGSTEAISGFRYDLFVVPIGRDVDREEDSGYCVFAVYEDATLNSYKWRDKTVEIEVEDGPIRYYKTFYGKFIIHGNGKVGDVELKVKKR